ncbi:tripartite tricarboxylate transporter substrate binding protein [Melaminivora sp.]|uniref:Bug family tripartite tricarboxylate transporter substrate binding protein n=1 Tax=Melaminivora sp. TaxID=1933032 RepID=UPI0028AE8F2A|nr:tripartite tricarboxylate transporter substrate binding protein [Melaminivora sp.]
MNTSFKKFLKPIALFSSGLLLAGSALAADFPNKSLEIIVPYSPGGPTDTLARVMAKALGENLGQPVIVKNVAGGGTLIGATETARAKPNGYTLMIGSSTPLVTAPIIHKAAYDPLKDFQYISTFGYQPTAIYVNADFPANNFKEFVAYAKAHPNEMNYATYGQGSAAHLAGELMQQEQGFKMRHVAYKGSAQAVVDVVGGQVPVGIDMIIPLLPHFEAKKIKILAVTQPQTIAQLPGVPSIDDYIKGFEGGSFFGIVAPAGLPADVTARLNQAVKAAMDNPDVKKNMNTLAMTTRTSTPEEFKEFVKSEIAKWTPIIEEANLKKK